MKFAWPDSQKRELLKCGSIAWVLSSGGGSANAVSAGGDEGDAASAGGAVSECCASAGTLMSTRSTRSHPTLIFAMSFNFPAPLYSAAGKPWPRVNYSMVQTVNHS